MNALILSDFPNILDHLSEKSPLFIVNIIFPNFAANLLGFDLLADWSPEHHDMLCQKWPAKGSAHPTDV